MPQYYNLTKYSDGENLMEIYSITDGLMTGGFSLFLVVVVFTFMMMFRQKRGDDLNDSLIYSSFFTLMLSMVLYASEVFYSGMQKPGLYLFLPAIVLVLSAAIKWYNNR